MKHNLVALLIPVMMALPAPAELRSMEPVPQEAAENSWWMKRHREKLAYIATNKTVDVVFLGDSITDFWERRHFPRWKHWFGYGDLTALNLGFAADRTEHLLWRIRNGELDGYEAKVVVLEIGTNNASGGSRPEDTAAGIRACLEAIHRKQPQARIVLNTIFPRGRSDEASRKAHAKAREVNEKVNAIIRGFADGSEVVLCDFNDCWIGEDGWGVPARLMPDGIHPSAEGYELWLSKLLPLLGR